MKKTICTIIALVVVFLPLAGCSEQAGSRGAMGSEIWETMPQLTYGEMEYEKLRVLPWNCGRCEATSFSTMAETEKGYYTLSIWRPIPSGLSTSRLIKGVLPTKNP